MAVLETIWVIHTTSRKDDADTDDSFVLDLPATGKAADSLGFSLPFKGQPHDERQRGRTDEYEFDVRGRGIDHQEAKGKIKIRTKGKDGWLPSSIWIIGRIKGGGHRLLAAHPNWPSNKWFSCDASEGKESYTF